MRANSRERSALAAAGRTGGAAALALALAVAAGCKSTRTQPTAGGGKPTTDAPFWADPPAADGRGPAAPAMPSVNIRGADPGRPPTGDPEVSGILAGRLLDGTNRPPGTAYIQVVAAGDSGTNAPAVDIETVNQGHFLIRGLHPGRTYELVARARVDGKLLVGRVQAQPPDVKLLISLSEELGGTVPPIPPPPPALPTRGKPVAPVVPQAPPAVTQPAGWTPAPDAADVELRAPRPSVPQAPEQVTGTAATAPVRANIGASEAHWSAPALTPPAPPAAGGRVSCRVAGNRVVELSLPDLDGQPWTLEQRRGKLLLLDFWGSWCTPCLKAIPEVSRLSNVYGPRGLEVIGIACENNRADENLRRVRDVRSKVSALTYRVLLAGEPGGDPVRREFALQSFPTLMLVDADGTILWRGHPNDRDLEPLLKQRLR